eukprot:16033990-Heterocapsa_arctica.AAC.1
MAIGCQRCIELRPMQVLRREGLDHRQGYAQHPPNVRHHRRPVGRDNQDGYRHRMPPFCCGNEMA